MLVYYPKKYQLTKSAKFLGSKSYPTIQVKAKNLSVDPLRKTIKVKNVRIGLSLYTMMVSSLKLRDWPLRDASTS